jgi:nitroreductase
MVSAELAEELFETWEVAGDDFPKSGTPAEKLRFLLRYAVLAPSSHNSQPWLFKIRDNMVEIYADRSRALPVVDPDDRELLISVGAAIFHLCVAMRHFGLEDDVRFFPDEHNPDLVARVCLCGPWVETTAEHDLFYAIPKRRTNRLPFFKKKLPVTLLQALQRGAEKQGAWLHIVEGKDARNALAALISQADHMQWSDKHFRRELAAWMHQNRSMSHDGIPGYAMGMNELVSMASPLVIRTFDLGNGQAAKDRDLAKGSPVLMVLGTEGDTPRDWVKVGEVLARVLLHAAFHDAYASYLNQPIEVAELRTLLRDLVGKGGYPQIVLRMGYGPEPELTPRRPVAEVLIP